ncbi:MAG TPA: tail fiber domain-containing protein [Bacillota bacterium]|nr:tail fiber domain-containing protein [Bacillota bacterium]
MEEKIQRMRYFDGLFLTETEFNLEQDYYRKMRYRHNRHLHNPGIVHGLEVTGSGNTVKVSAGIALNKVHEEGEDISKEIILLQEELIDLSKPSADSAEGEPYEPYQSKDTVYIYLYLEEVMEDTALSKDGKQRESHWTERARIGHSKDPADKKNNEKIILAKGIWDGNGIQQISRDECIYAGLSGNVLETKKLLLKADEWASQFSLEGSPQGIRVNGDITLNGALTVSGNLVMSGPDAQLQVAHSLAVGPLSIGPGDGRLMVTGPMAGIELVRRGLTTWPEEAQLGDRFIWYNRDGTMCLWTDSWGDFLQIDPWDIIFSGNCNFGSLSTRLNCDIGCDCSVGHDCWIGSDCHIMGGLYNQSSIQWKENISPVTDALAKVNRMNPVFFNWKPEHGGKDDLGFIAEEMETILPEVVARDKEGNANAIDYSKLSPIAIAAIKELIRTTNELKTKNGELEARLESLETGAGK